MEKTQKYIVYLEIVNPDRDAVHDLLCKSINEGDLDAIDVIRSQAGDIQVVGEIVETG